MYELTKSGVVALNEAEHNSVFSDVYDKGDKNYHYLAFDRQFGGYCPLNVYVSKHEPSLLKREKAVFTMLLAKREACSFYPKLNLTLYPLTKLEGPDYEIDLANVDKHFADILELNDKVYKTKYLFVNFGHGASNFDQDLILGKLGELLKKSKVLEKIYIEFLAK